MRKHMNAFGGRLIRSSVLLSWQTSEGSDEVDANVGTAENVAGVEGEASGVGRPLCLVSGGGDGVCVEGRFRDGQRFRRVPVLVL